MWRRCRWKSDACRCGLWGGCRRWGRGIRKSYRSWGIRESYRSGRCGDGGWCNRGNFSDGCRHPGINNLLDVGLGRTRGSTAPRAGRDNNYANGPKDANKLHANVGHSRYSADYVKLQPFYPDSAVVAFSIAGLTRHRRPQTNSKYCGLVGC